MDTGTNQLGRQVPAKTLESPVCHYHFYLLTGLGGVKESLLHQLGVGVGQNNVTWEY